MGEFASDYREAVLTDDGVAALLTAQGANTPGAFVVPKNAQYITAIKIKVSGIVTDVVTGNTTTVHFIGLPGQQWYAGPLLSLAGAAATSGGFAYHKGEVYQTRIPVSGIGQFEAEAIFRGDDPGQLHVGVQVEYDGVPGVITDADVREIAIGAAANTLVALTYRGASTTAGNFKTNGRPIKEIRFGAALDPTGDAANGLVWMPALHLDGNGLVTSNKPLKFLGPSGPTQPDTDVSGNQNTVAELERIVPGMGIKTQQGEVEASAQNIESINPGEAICCLCYG